jgi:hypothetical protein
MEIESSRDKRLPTFKETRLQPNLIVCNDYIHVALATHDAVDTAEWKALLFLL